jgi:hypothetical protein
MKYCSRNDNDLRKESRRLTNHADTHDSCRVLEYVWLIYVFTHQGRRGIPPNAGTSLRLQTKGWACILTACQSHIEARCKNTVTHISNSHKSVPPRCNTAQNHGCRHIEGSPLMKHNVKWGRLTVTDGCLTTGLAASEHQKKKMHVPCGTQRFLPWKHENGSLLVQEA